LQNAGCSLLKVGTRIVLCQQQLIMVLMLLIGNDFQAKFDFSYDLTNLLSIRGEVDRQDIESTFEYGLYIFPPFSIHSFDS
jgi:hypothetical protein